MNECKQCGGLHYGTPPGECPYDPEVAKRHDKLAARAKERRNACVSTLPTREQVAALRLIEARATEGPWEASDSDDIIVSSTGRAVFEGKYIVQAPDLELIAALRNAAPALLSLADYAHDLTEAAQGVVEASGILPFYFTKYKNAMTALEQTLPPFCGGRERERKKTMNDEKKENARQVALLEAVRLHGGEARKEGESMAEKVASTAIRFAKFLVEGA